MSNTPRTVVRIETTTVIVEIGAVQPDPLGTYGSFLAVRNRHADPSCELRDRAKYGRCIICRQPFGDGDQVHAVFEVTRNGCNVGNRLSCGPCAAQHTTQEADRD